jgi:uncharacterized protein YlxW (UPF0749 family)
LNYLTAHSLDDDYAHVAQSTAAAGEPAGDDEASRRRPGPATWVALALFGLLVATAAVQAAREEPVQRRSQESLVSQVNDRRAELAETRDQLAALRGTVDRAQRDALAASAAGRELRDRLQLLGVATGTAAASGPGVQVVVDDSPGEGDDKQVVLDTDLQILVNGLWNSGAEAIAINGQRLTNLSSIRVAGEAVTVNLRSLSRPYTVTALGDPDQLAARFLDSEGGTWWLNLEAVYQLRFDMTTEEELTVPGAPPFALRHARVPRGGAS